MRVLSTMTKVTRISPISLLMATVTLLAACAGEETEPKDWALACQTMKCICEEPDPGITETPERAVVLWADNGDAYCPEGYKLRSAKPEDSEFLRKHGG